MYRSRKAKGPRKGQKKKNGRDAEDDTRQYPPVAKASMDIIVWQNPRVRDPLPQRFRTVFTMAFEGVTAAGTGPSRYFVYGNSVITPASGGGWTNSNPAIASLQPTGLTRLLNSTSYQVFKVHGSRISVEMAPQAQVDTVVLAVTPSFLSTQPANYGAAIGQQFTRDKMLVEGTPRSSRTVINKMATHRLYGVRPQAIEDDLSGKMQGDVTTHPANPWFWVITFELSGNGVLINGLPYRVTVEYDCELYGDATADNVITLRKIQKAKASLI
jgi:hypothetical protein